ncbi:MAG: hypothetical protein P4L27_03650 [Ignavibacteriaceae bacterium]|nr:hypothetical protein [Ignavibacteriaceae bacterium]
MGTLKNQILGDVSGKVGCIIGRKRKGKFFIYAAPGEVKISNTPEAIKSRSIMIPLAKFASVVNSIPELKYFWLKSKINAFDAFHKIERLNYPFLTFEKPTIYNTIVPEIFIKNEINEASISSKGIKLTILSGEKAEKQLKRGKVLTGIGVICYFNPKMKEMDYFHLSKVRTSPIEMKIDKQIEVDIPFNADERSNYNSYLNSILYFTIVSKDNYGEPLKFFCNYRNEFRHEFTDEKERFSLRDSQP